jgi:hypothetical protein
MSDLIVKPDQIPAYFDREDVDSNNALLNNIGGCPMVKIDQKTFCMSIEGEKVSLGTSIVCIFVGANDHYSKAYFKEKYQPGRSVSPDCASANGVTPDSSIKNPICDTCAKCPKNVFGSKISEFGKKIKECPDKIRTVVYLPQVTGDIKLFRFDIPPASFSAVKGYWKKLQMGGIPYLGAVLTKICFDPNSQYAQLLFAIPNNGILSEADYLKIKEIRKDPEIERLLKMEVVSFDDDDEIGVDEKTAEMLASEATAITSKKVTVNKETKPALKIDTAMDNFSDEANEILNSL